MDTIERPTLTELADQKTDPNYSGMITELLSRVSPARDNAPQVAAFNSSI